MAWSSGSTVNVIELVAYLIVTPFALYLWRVHGSQMLLGSLYICLFCCLRIVADIIALLPDNRNASKPNKTSAILSAIGLSPLILILSGYAHYIHQLRLQSTQYANQQNSRSKSDSKHRTMKLLLMLMQIQIHLAAGVCVYLSVEGSLKLFDNPSTLTASETHHGQTEREAGALIFLLLWIEVVLYVLFLSTRARRNSGSSIELDRLTFWTLGASLPIGAKMIYTVVYSFDHTDADLNPITGSLWVKIVFVFLLPLLAVLCLCTGAFLSRHVRKTKRAGLPDRQSQQVTQY